MAAAAQIFNHQITNAAQTFAGKSASSMTTSTNGTSSTDSSSDSSDSGATISANDFLTLLVTEMQNQDPTADTDPNEYIDQLVQVNSLEQLIDINQTLSTAMGGTATSNNGATGQTAGAADGSGGTNAASGTDTAHSVMHKAGGPQMVSISAHAAALQTEVARPIAGNLSVPSVNPAAQRVGHALDRRTRAQPITGSR
jgi:flagellar basal-body rod modification protein FlgD